VNIPDYISPIVGYRTWQRDTLGLRSLNNEPWTPGQALEARCLSFSVIFGPDAPHERCTCGIYAAKNLEHLFDIGYMKRGDIHGEVFLWGKMCDHDLGYRAEYAYPKNIVLPPDKVPFKLCEVESRLESLIAYGVDIFIAAPPPDIAAPKTDIPHDIPLWTKAPGINQAGFDWIRRMRER
jgi:hypothetical protein